MTDSRSQQMVAALRHALIDLKASRTLVQHTMGEPNGLNQTIALVEAALSAPPISTGEPVAWRWKPRLSSTWIYNPERAWLDLQDPAEINIEPLYAAPASGDVIAALNERCARYERRCHELETASGGVRAAVIEALNAARPEIVRQHDRCNSDDEVAYFDGILAKIDRALSQAPATDAALVAQRIEQGSSKSEVAGSIPAERASHLVSRLREVFQERRYGGNAEYHPDFDLFDAAADEIERLRRQA